METGKDVSSENRYIVKANKLIEAKGRLGTVEQKLLATLISQIKPSDTDFQQYEINILEVAEFINLKHNTIYERIKTATRNLQNKEIFIEEVNKKGKNEFLVTRIFSSAKYVEGEGSIQILIDPNLKPYLLAINGKETPFTKYMIKNILKLYRSYSIRLYEILKQWQRVKNKNFELQHLRELLGADSKGYDVFSEFERSVLKPSKKEINENTDIFITYKKKKTGRRISHIEFEIETKVGEHNLVEEQHKIDESENLFDYNFIKNNSGMGKEKLSRTQIHNIYVLAVKRTENYGIDELDYIELNYNYAKERASEGLYSYILKAIDKDYAKAIIRLGRLDIT